MKESEARQHIEHMRLACQKARSNIMESWRTPDYRTGEWNDGLSEEEWLATVEGGMVQDLNPWLFGPKCILIGIERALDKPEIDPGEFYNLAYIAHTPQLEPLLGIGCVTYGWLEMPTIEEFTTLEWDPEDPTEET